jgi:hypothetical protein
VQELPETAKNCQQLGNNYIAIEDWHGNKQFFYTDYTPSAGYPSLVAKFNF